MTLPSEERHPWIGLSIGNSRLHWFYYQGHCIDKTWDTPHISRQLNEIPSDWQVWQQYSPAFAYHVETPRVPDLWILSVVPSQTQFWQTYPQARVLASEDIPMQFPYPTFGLDRALAIWAAGVLYQWPVLVIDAGTALTYTGAISAECCLGGAILPGLGLQLRSLNQSTPELPSVALPIQLPTRWSLDTPAAIQSGILYTLISGMTDFIQAWLDQYPTSTVVITGGDAALLYRYLSQTVLGSAESDLWSCIILEPLLQSLGLQRLRQLGLGKRL